MLQASALLVVILILFVAVLAQLFSLPELENLPSSIRAMVEVGAILVFAPLQTGIIMMAVHAQRGQQIKFSDILRYLPQTLILAVNQLVISIAVQLGLSLLLLPGIYLMIATTFSLPLIADRQCSVTQAIILSCKAVNTYFIQFLGVFAIFAVLFVIGVLTSGFAFIWIIPVYFSVTGILYNDLFGQVSDTSSVSPTSSETTFNA